ncbi:MAG TPA: excinuclease ABC subunit UvrB [Rhodospirillaceae bacterium]|nr:MAG: excinuclease ABC subunit B [Alphaproteobacteria bacterium GWF2_58_20]HAU29670.1 excinuclease ABC subunit UvrB [Rhodospirillaceae bacterium]
MTSPFKLTSPFLPAGDQPQAIVQLLEGLGQEERNQVLLGVTGSGKTFTMAQVIAQTGRPALILAPNKTLAAQLYSEMKGFFPENAVEYFVSYYDYYQPEAYVPRTDTYIEKESTINEQIDRMRHSATQSLLERRDVVIVASVSCIYGIGSPESYSSMTMTLAPGMKITREVLAAKFVELHYKRGDMDFVRGRFRMKGDVVEVFPAHLEDRAWRLSLFGDEIEDLWEVDPLTGAKLGKLSSVKLYANSHYVTPKPTMATAIKQIAADLESRLAELRGTGQLLAAERLEQRTRFDLEMMVATGFCSGIENYSRYLTGRAPGDPPPTLFEYLPEDALLFVDESHVAVPQLHAMYRGDRKRKETLSEYGFRLPSCMDNRPLKFEEWERFRPQTVFVSATPGVWEIEQAGGTFVEQVVRPTGLMDPLYEVRPTQHQVDDLMDECRKVMAMGGRILVTTLTKKMAEALSGYFAENGMKVSYLHSDVDTLERIEIIRDLRRGVFDILVGINLLREGLDIPECQLVAILDADKEGFLRGRMALIQTMGRAARNVDGRVLLYADRVTDSMAAAFSEVDRRRARQMAYNMEHGITPQSVKKAITDVMKSVYEQDHVTVPMEEELLSGRALATRIAELSRKMRAAAADLDFENAARFRDEIRKLEMGELER